MPAFTRRHYVAIATVMSELKDSHHTDDLTLDKTTQRLSDLFRSDNPRFNSDKFEDVCRCLLKRL
jgi:hypothetical protein